MLLKAHLRMSAPNTQLCQLTQGCQHPNTQLHELTRECPHPNTQLRELTQECLHPNTQLPELTPDCLQSNIQLQHATQLPNLASGWSLFPVSLAFTRHANTFTLAFCLSSGYISITCNTTMPYNIWTWSDECNIGLQSFLLIELIFYVVTHPYSVDFTRSVSDVV